MLDRDGVRGVGELIDIIFDHLFVEISRVIRECMSLEV